MPLGKISQVLGESREASFIVLCTVAMIRDTNTGKDIVLVNVEVATVVENDFEHGVLPTIVFGGLAGIGHSKNESISKRSV